ncbi:unnamed protein product [Rhizophagus irregularis]|uniref:Uncharacterized protein n=1 Tax=Rhizophagus irregularis TaxID=588596 RepID=A0A2I1EYI2_9GLOM|nr:hypothetical protein RhiirB3_442797 [Rhizophagus irregularis]CAB5377324.1 unnamed protein product [Rhizophagus irregularis]
MNNYQEIFFLINQTRQRFHGSIFESIIFRNGIKHHIIKRKTNGISNFSNFIIGNIVFFSFIQLASASITIDTNYKSQEDLYDAILNTFFPIFFVILLNVSGKTGSIKNIVLPLLDDILYNMITWMIPLIVSFAYDDLMSIKIFSIINMCLHVICAVLSIITAKRVGEIFDNYGIVDSDFFVFIFAFLIFFPVLVIPIFWIIIIAYSHTIASTSIIFLTLFGICLISLMSIFILIFIEHNFKYEIGDKTFYILYIISFYVPNILQTLLIALSWPINFYFIKACVFILILSLTRNVSYFTDRVPKDFLATSTTMTQCVLISVRITGDMQNIFRRAQMSIEEMHEKQEEMHKIQKTMQAEIDEMQTTMQTKIDEMQISMQMTMQTKIDEMQTTMQTKIDEIQKTINENKT